MVAQERQVGGKPQDRSLNLFQPLFGERLKLEQFEILKYQSAEICGLISRNSVTVPSSNVIYWLQRMGAFDKAERNYSFQDTSDIRLVLDCAKATPKDPHPQRVDRYEAFLKPTGDYWHLSERYSLVITEGEGAILEGHLVVGVLPSPDAKPGTTLRMLHDPIQMFEPIPASEYVDGMTELLRTGEKAKIARIETQKKKEEFDYPKEWETTKTK